MSATGFNFASFLGRLVAALILVFATYNPSGYSYFHWVEQSLSEFDPLVAFAGVGDRLLDRSGQRLDPL